MQQGHAPDDLPAGARDLARRLGAQPDYTGSIVTLAQAGRMKRALGKDSWMHFHATQIISVATCGFEWRARFGPLGLISVCDALEGAEARLDVTAFGLVPIARTTRTPALFRGELMRYLGEIAWAPDAILTNPALRWRDDGPDKLIVATGDGETAVEIILTLDNDGRIGTIFAPDRPRSATEPILLTPWRGHFSAYRQHLGRWLPFAGEVAWEIDGAEEVYWQGRITDWAENTGV